MVLDEIVGEDIVMYEFWEIVRRNAFCSEIITPTVYR